MFRFLLRRVPRFGILTLFTAMLLFVSGAGWVKFHQDLLKEEEELFAAFAEAGCEFTYRRQEGEPARSDAPADDSTSTSRETWFSDTEPLFARVMSIQLDRGAPRELLERAARLPSIRNVRCYANPDERLPMAEEFGRRIGLTKPSFERPSTEVDPLPNGEPIDDDEAARILEAIQGVWNRPWKRPERGVVYEGRAGRSEPTGITAFDGQRIVLTISGVVTVGDRERMEQFATKEGRLRQTWRTTLPDLTNDLIEELRVPLHGQGSRAALDVALLNASAGYNRNLQALFDTSPADAFRVKRIDDIRYRLEFPPVVIPYPSASVEDELRVTAILRSDLDWNPEAFDTHVTRTSTAPAADDAEPEETTLSYRAAIRREGGCVVVESSLSERLRSAPGGAAPALTPERRYGVAAYDLVSDVDLSSIDAATFDAELLPPSRKLSTFRWYFATLAISLALLGFAAIRNVTDRFRRRAGEVTPPSPIPDSGSAVASENSGA